ncbi:sensor histidine kinase [Streptomyces tanashiensis]|uniref:sensor histidine kinase n=1 Tax=Streptomyces tanashiensis TaxID=67367 RepID=UPI0033DA4306
MIRRWRQHLRDHPRAADAALAALCLVLAGPGTILQVRGSAGLPSWPGVLIAVVGCAALMWRRHRPGAVLAITTLAAVADGALGYLPTILLLAPLMVALYTVTLHRPPRTAYLHVGLSTAAVIAGALLGGPAQEPLVLKTAAPSAWLLLPAALGSLNRLHRALLAAERTRAEQAEQTREEEASRRVAEERLRIARELHDVVAHHLALANAQANTVARLMRHNPAQAQHLVQQLTATTGEALREMKATVALMRRPDAAAPTEPVPGLAQLPALLDAFATSGLQVTLTVDGTSRPLPPGIDLNAYRIIQEALTNVTKHAATDHAEVRLHYTSNRLRITVTNDGPARPLRSAAPGYGILGMRERAQSVGGHLHTQQEPGGGFAVTTDLPLPPAPQPGSPAVLPE